MVFFTSRSILTTGVSAGDLEEGALVTLNENGQPVEFYVAKQNYESGLNGAGRVLMVRKDCYNSRIWDGMNINAYASSDIDAWLNGTYKNMLDADVQEATGTTRFYYTLGNGNTSVSTLERDVFALSLTELGKVQSYANVEGNALPIASTLQIAYKNGNTTAQWTRTPHTGNTNYAWRLDSVGNADDDGCVGASGSRPCFTLPSTFKFQESQIVS